MASLRTLLIVAAACLFAASCKTTQAEDQLKLQAELGGKIPLWVEVECSKKGKPIFNDYSVLKMPDEKVVWALAKLDDFCRVYGALVKKGRKGTDLCDIRFRSQEPVSTKGRCRCVAGRYKLQEGRPTSKRCCEKHPDSVHCKPDQPGAGAPVDPSEKADP